MMFNNGMETRLPAPRYIPTLPGGAWMRVCVFPCCKRVVISLNVTGSVKRVGGKEGLPFHSVCVCVCVHLLFLSVCVCVSIILC